MMHSLQNGTFLEAANSHLADHIVIYVQRCTHSLLTVYTRRALCAPRPAPLLPHLMYRRYMSSKCIIAGLPCPHVSHLGSSMANLHSTSLCRAWGGGGEEELGGLAQPLLIQGWCVGGLVGGMGLKAGGVECAAAGMSVGPGS